MSVAACAAAVARGDPDRFAAAMLAPPALRPRLLALYAFNLEVARAPWVTQEPLIAEMRLQWWADTVAEVFDGAPPRAHEVATPLAEAIRGSGWQAGQEPDLPKGPFEALISARRGDVIGARTACDPCRAVGLSRRDSRGLTWLAARALGAGPRAEAPARALGAAGGAVRMLRARPQLSATGRDPLALIGDGAAADLVDGALARCAAARRSRSDVARAATPAFMTDPCAEHVLRQMHRDPAARCHILRRPDATPRC